MVDAIFLKSFLLYYLDGLKLPINKILYMYCANHSRELQNRQVLSEAANKAGKQETNEW